PVGKAWEEVSASFDRFCLAAGIETLGAMMEADAEVACGPRHSRSDDRRGHRWGRTAGKIGFHAGKVAIERPRVRGLNGKELPLASWEHAVEEDRLGQWAMNLMLINVSTRKFRRAVRLPEGDVPAPAGSCVSKSAASRHFVALSAARMQEWMAADLSKLDLLVVQIDGIHMTGDLVLVAALGIDGEGVKHPLGLIEGATENSAVVQALIDSLLARGLDPAVPRLFIIDGSKVPDSQGSQHHGAAAEAVACRCPPRAAPSLGVGRRREGREIDPQSRTTAGTRRAGRIGEHSGGPRRNPHCHAARPAERTSSGARLHQHRGECHEHSAARLPQREAMAIGLDGAAMDRGGYAGSSKRLPPTEGAQATTNAPCRSGSTSNETLNSRRPCSPSQRRVTSTLAATASQCSTKSGTSPLTTFAMKAAPFILPAFSWNSTEVNFETRSIARNMLSLPSASRNSQISMWT